MTFQQETSQASSHREKISTVHTADRVHLRNGQSYTNYV